MVRLSVPVRARGMSSQHRFFDEETVTRWVSEKVAILDLRSPVDLESEINLENLRTKVTGSFRVVWMVAAAATRPTGLQLIESDGDLWGLRFPPLAPGDEEAFPKAWLQCQRCRQSFEAAVPEAESEFLVEGFTLARDCDRCKATTAWNYGVEIDALLVDSPRAEAKPAKKTGQELRGKGRAPIKMQIKVVRKRYGLWNEEICETINVSRNGAYFHTPQRYDVGELIEVVLPYKEGDVAIPVPARVVRLDAVKDSDLVAVAIRMEQGQAVPPG